ncbi:MAG: PD-(D/E)XK nuclease family protein [Sphaerochaetaceae bacterium]|nr:PD-(D/E)XK nuclease family protein [Sphaerochaetaceae bacterium]
MTLREEIFRLLTDEKCTLVFPTENSARYYLSEYVREKKCSVLASRAISFDDFAAIFAPRHEKLRPANKYHRLSFISSMLESGKSGLSYLYSDSLVSYSQRFVPFLSRILPALDEGGVEGHITNKHLFLDLQILKSRYSDFLSEHSLFEPGWEKHSVKNNRDTVIDHVLVGFDAEIPMQRLFEELEDKSGIRVLDIPASASTVYEKFDSEEAELELLFSRLIDLKKKNIAFQDIILSTPELDRLDPLLERKSLEYDIPLVFMKSLKIKESVPGRFLFAIERCYNEKLSFRSLENLLLNSAFPYLDMEKNRSLISFMIQSNIQRGSINYKGDDELFTKLSRAHNPLLEFYKALKGGLIAVCTASEGQSLISSLHALSSLLFGPDEFKAGEVIDMEVYSFVINELSQFSRVISESGLKVSNLFATFMSEAENISYVSQEKDEGIPVYSYGQDYLMDVKYRFVFGINDKSYRREEKSLSFLLDHEIENRKCYSATDSLISYYQSVSENTFITGSEMTNEGPEETPTYFVLNDKIVKGHAPEKLVGKGLENSLEEAKLTSLANSGCDIASSDEKGYRKIDTSNYHFSYSAISKYAKCPYRAFLEYDLVPDNSDDENPDVFEPSKQDDAAIGTFLHEVIQAFMANHFNELLTIEHIEDYNSEIEGLLVNLLEDNRVFDDFTKRSIKGKYLASLQGVVLFLLVPKKLRGKAVGSFRPKSNELPLCDGTFTGYVDTVIEDADGRVYLLDYKKGSAPATYQLILYSHLYEKENIDDVENAFFYSMKDAEFKGFSSDKWAEEEEKLQLDYQSTRDGYEEGAWKATPGKENCSYCKERSICRRRYNLR